MNVGEVSRPIHHRLDTLGDILAGEVGVATDQNGSQKYDAGIHGARTEGEVYQLLRPVNGKDVQ